MIPIVLTANDLQDISVDQNEFVNLIRADVKDGRAVKSTVNIPKERDDKVSETGPSLSYVLQEASREKFNVI